MPKLLKNRDNIVAEIDPKQLEEDMKKDLKDKIIPYHNMPYSEQINNKEQFLKQVFAKFVARVGRDCESGIEQSYPGWLKKYHQSIKPAQTEANQTNEEIKEPSDANPDPNTPVTDDQLPCPFKGVVQCSPDYMQGYRNKVEFTVGRQYFDKKICVGFMKGNTNKGILYVDYPYTFEESDKSEFERLVPMPHISLKSVQ